MGHATGGVLGGGMEGGGKTGGVDGIGGSGGGGGDGGKNTFAHLNCNLLWFVSKIFNAL